jgi:hypothetical protein
MTQNLILFLLTIFLKDVNCEIQNLSSNETLDEYYFTNRIATNYVWTTVPIAFLILGTISNLLSIIIFLRREMRKYSSFVYFAILNIINFLLIYVTFIRVIMEFNFKIDIRVLNIFTCKLHVFLTYFLGHISSLMICSISIDRVISVVFLHKAKVLCTPKIAIVVTICLIIFDFLMSSHFLFFESAYIIHQTNISSTISGNNVLCEPRRGTTYANFIDNAWKIIDMSHFAIVPFIIMTICSIIIIIRVAEQSRKVQTHKKRETKRLLKKRANSITNQTSTSMASGENISTPKLNTKFSSRTRNLALMLIPVNILFLIFLAPVVMVMYFYAKLENDKLTLAIVELLATCNYTFNFIIYFLTSSKFREEFSKLINEIFLICFKEKPLKRNSIKTNINLTTIVC